MYPGKETSAGPTADGDASAGVKRARDQSADTNKKKQARGGSSNPSNVDKASAGDAKSKGRKKTRWDQPGSSGADGVDGRPWAAQDKALGGQARANWIEENMHPASAKPPAPKNATPSIYANFNVVSGSQTQSTTRSSSSSSTNQDQQETAPNNVDPVLEAPSASLSSPHDMNASVQQQSA